MAKLVFNKDGVITAIKKAQINVDGVIKAVKKIQANIGGVIKTIWTAGITYVGTVTPLSVARAYCGAGSIGDYALFVGGDQGWASPSVNTIDAYNSSLVRSTPVTLSNPAQGQGSALIGNYLLFAGGDYHYKTTETSTSTGNGSTPNAFTSTLVRTALTNPSAIMGEYTATATAGTSYAIFHSGGDDRFAGSTALYYNTSLVGGIFPIGVFGYSETAGASVGNYAVFTGGYDYDKDDGDWVTLPQKATVAISSSLVKTTCTNAPYTHSNHGVAANWGGYALFINTGGTATMYNSSLVMTSVTLFSSVTGYVHGAIPAKLGEYLFVTGYRGTADPSTSLMISYTLNSSLVYSVVESTATRRSCQNVAVIGSYVLVAGGGTSGSWSYGSVVDAYSA